MGNMILAATSYTKAITSLKSVLLTLGSEIGAVMLVYGGIKFDMAFLTTLVPDPNVLVHLCYGSNWQRGDRDHVSVWQVKQTDQRNHRTGGYQTC